MKRSAKQQGFGHVGTALVILLIAVLGGVGWFVYNQKNKSSDKANKSITSFAECAAAGNPIMESYPEQCAANGKTFVNDKSRPVQMPDETLNWVLFTPEDKAYSVRVPDGWLAVSLHNNLYVRQAKNLTYKAGTKATIEMLQEGGWDGSSPFALINPGSYHDQIVRKGKEVGTIKTDAGVTAHKHSYVGTAADENYIDDLNGATVYDYYFDADGKYLQISHVVRPGDADQHELIERMIRTIQIK